MNRIARHALQLAAVTMNGVLIFWLFSIKLLGALLLVLIVISFAQMLGLAPLELATGMIKRKAVASKAVAVPLIVVSMAIEIYFLAGWSAFSALRTISYTAQPEVTADWLYWLRAFGGCVAPPLLKVLAPSSNDVIDSGAVVCLYIIAAIIAFLVFAIWPSAAALPFGWFLRYPV